MNQKKTNIDLLEKVETTEKAELLLSNWLRVSRQEGTTDIILELYSHCTGKLEND